MATISMTIPDVEEEVKGAIVTLARQLDITVAKLLRVLLDAYRRQHGMDKLPAQSASTEASTASSTPQNTSESQLVGVESGLEQSGTRHTSLEDFHLPLSLTDNVYADHCAIYVKTEKDYSDYPGSAAMDDVERRNRDMLMAYGIPGTSRYYDESMESNSDCVRANITKKLQDGEYRLEMDYSKRSKAWKQFGIVTDETGQKMKYVACKQCFHTYSHGRNGGTATTTLLSHVCGGKTKKVASENPVNEHPVNENPVVSSSEKQDMCNSCVHLIVEDIRPYSIINGSGFKQVMETAMSIQRQYKEAVSVDDILPDSTTISWNVMAAAGAERERLSLEIRRQLTLGGVAMTTEMWTDAYGQISYITVTVHYVDAHWELQSRVAFTKEVNMARNQPGLNILAALTEGFLPLKVCERDLVPCIFTTDRSSDMMAALKDHVRLDCTACVLSSCLEHLLTNDDAQQVAVKKLIEKVTLLTTSLKAKSWPNHLNITDKQCVCTRWSSTYSMCKNILEQHSHIQALLQEKEPGRMGILRTIDVELLKQLVMFIKPFVTASDLMDGGATNNISYVIPIMDLITKGLECKDADLPAIKHLKVKCLDIVHKKFQPHMQHQIGLFFNPKFKSLHGLGVKERRETIATVRAWVDDHSPVRTPEPKVQCEEDLFADFMSKRRTPDSETDKYLDISENEDLSIYQFWELLSPQFPVLSRLVRQTLAVMPTCVPSERCFSMPGHLCAERRATLPHGTVDNILLLNNQYSKK